MSAVQKWRNHYRHRDCPVEPGVEWEDVWSCQCNDHCPACDREIEPYDSEELGGKTQGRVENEEGVM